MLDQPYVQSVVKPWSLVYSEACCIIPPQGKVSGASALGARRNVVALDHIVWRFSMYPLVLRHVWVP